MALLFYLFSITNSFLLSLLVFLSSDYFLILGSSPNVIFINSPTFFFYVANEMPLSFAQLIHVFCENSVFYSDTLYFSGSLDVWQDLIDLFIFFLLTTGCYFFYNILQKNNWGLHRSFNISFMLFFLTGLLSYCVVLFFLVVSVIDLFGFIGELSEDLGVFDDCTDTFQISMVMSISLFFFLSFISVLFFFSWRTPLSFLFLLLLCCLLLIVLEDTFGILIGILGFREVCLLRYLVMGEYYILHRN